MSPQSFEPQPPPGITSAIDALRFSIPSGPERSNRAISSTRGETSLRKLPWRLRPFLLLLAALLLIQPSVRAAQADEPGPVEFVVGGVAGATVRAEPNGTSNVVATVPAGGLVTQAGPDVTTS